MVIDTDGSAFITKAEFDSLKNNFQAQIDNYNTSIDSKIDGAIAAYLAGIKLTQSITVENPYKVVNKSECPIFVLSNGNQGQWYQEWYCRGWAADYVPYSGIGRLDLAYLYSSDEGSWAKNFSLPFWEYNDAKFPGTTYTYANPCPTADQLHMYSSDGEFIDDCDNVYVTWVFSEIFTGYGLQRDPINGVINLDDDFYPQGFHSTGEADFQTGFQTSYDYNNTAHVKDVLAMQRTDDPKCNANYGGTGWGRDDIKKVQHGSSYAIEKSKKGSQTWIDSTTPYSDPIIIGNNFSNNYKPVVAGPKNKWDRVKAFGSTSSWPYNFAYQYGNTNHMQKRDMAGSYNAGAPTAYTFSTLVLQEHDFDTYNHLKGRKLTSAELKHTTGGSGYFYEGLPFFYYENKQGVVEFDIKISNWKYDSNSKYNLLIKKGPFTETWSTSTHNVDTDAIPLSVSGYTTKTPEILKDVQTHCSFHFDPNTQYYLQIYGQNGTTSGMVSYFSDFNCTFED